MRRILSLLIMVMFLCLFGAKTAWAQLLYSGGEDIDFLCATSGTCSVMTGATYRSGWAREAYGVGGTTTDPPTSLFATPNFTPVSTVWIHAQFCQSGFTYAGCGYFLSPANPTTANAQMLRVMDSAGNPTLVLLGTGTAGQVTIASRSSSGTFTNLVTCSGAFNTALTQIDLSIKYGPSGSITLYNNSAQACTYSGDVTNGDGSTTLDAVSFASPSTSNSAWSEVIVAESDTRAMARFTANTSGNGNTTGFTGTNICSSIWNAITNNDENFGYTTENNVIQECTINSAIPGGAYTVLGLVMSARALVGGTGPQHFDFVTGIGGANYTSPEYAPGPAYSNFINYIQTTNPATGNPWAVTGHLQ